MAEDNERISIIVTLLGERVELFMPGNGWTYTEAKLAKAISDGMSPVEIGNKFFEGDPDATMAIIRVTFHRAGRNLTKAELEQLAEIDLESIGRDVLAAIEAAANPPTPAKAGESTTPVGPSTTLGNGFEEQPSANGANGTQENHSKLMEPEASEIAGPQSSVTS